MATETMAGTCYVCLKASTRDFLDNTGKVLDAWTIHIVTYTWPGKARVMQNIG